MQNMVPKTEVITAALICRGDDILLVRQQGSDDPQSFWALPGGLVEKGELVTDGLVREVREETGLRVLKVGELLYVVQAVNADDNSQWLAFVLEATCSNGDPLPDDPDGHVLEACFVPKDEAISHLEQLPWPSMSGPITAYLRGEYPAGTMWFYRETDDQQEPISISRKNRG